MSDTAKLFMSGRSQAVRLPKAYRMDCDEVDIARDGDALVLRPRRGRAWGNLLAALDGFDSEQFADCFPDGRQQPEDRPGVDLDDILDA